MRRKTPRRLRKHRQGMSGIESHRLAALVDHHFHAARRKGKERPSENFLDFFVLALDKLPGMS